MRLAVVGWAADSGVGRELIEAVRHLPVQSAFVLPNQAKPTRKDLVSSVACHFAVQQGPALAGEMRDFLVAHRPDTVLTWEVPGSWDFPAIWAQLGIRWIHVVHWDWFSVGHMHLWKQAAKLVSPNDMCRRELAAIGLPSVHLPVPVDTDRLEFLERKKAENFVSVYGYGGLENRRSIPELFAAWRAIPNPPPLKVLVQAPPSEPEARTPPPNAEIYLGNMPEPADLYAEGDVAVQPSRYEGVGISMLEAQARGMPVIAVDRPPMNEVAPDLPVAVERTVQVRLMGKEIPSHIPSVESIRKRIVEIRGTDISDLSRAVRKRVEEQFSWNALRERWVSALSGR
jgi:glycosyltransferase involved in cell wall biosynthesis